MFIQIHCSRALFLVSYNFFIYKEQTQKNTLRLENLDLYLYNLYNINPNLNLSLILTIQNSNQIQCSINFLDCEFMSLTFNFKQQRQFIIPNVILSYLIYQLLTLFCWIQIHSSTNLNVLNTISDSPIRHQYKFQGLSS